MAAATYSPTAVTSSITDASPHHNPMTLAPIAAVAAPHLLAGNHHSQQPATAAPVAATSSSSSNSVASNFVQYITLAGLANVAGQTCGHPFDLLKIRMQMQGQGARVAGEQRKYRSPWQGLRVVYAEEGLANGNFSGWRVSCAREFWYSGLRMGLYEPVKELCGATDPKSTPLSLKIVAATITGFIAATLSNPLDLLKVRYQAATGETKAQLPPWPRALVGLCQQGGVKALYRGYTPNCGRAVGITLTQLASYDHIKHHVLRHQWLDEGPVLHAVTSAIASLICIAFTNPIDVLKTRMMSGAARPDESVTTVTRGILRAEGPAAFYKGALLAWLRLGPHTVVTFMTFELMRGFCGIRPI